MPEYFVVSSLNRSHGTLLFTLPHWGKMFWKAPSGQHLARLMLSLTCLLLTSIGSSLKPLSPSLPLPFDVSAIFCSCLFLYHLIIQNFQQLKSGVASGFPLCLWCSRCMPPHHQGMLPASVSHQKNCFVLIVQHNILMKHFSVYMLCMNLSMHSLKVVRIWYDIVIHGDDTWCPMCPSSFMTAQRGRTLPPQSHPTLVAVPKPSIKEPASPGGSFCEFWITYKKGTDWNWWGGSFQVKKTSDERGYLATNCKHHIFFQMCRTNPS